MGQYGQALRSAAAPLSFTGAAFVLSLLAGLSALGIILAEIVALGVCVLCLKFWSLTDPCPLPLPDLHKIVAPRTLRLLTLNAFMRPPGIAHEHGDFKDFRMEKFKRIFLEYDIICMQEVFCSFSFRRRTLITWAREAGLRYFAAPPPVGLCTKQALDCGLLILSRYPIVETGYCHYSLSVHEDKFAEKGSLYARVAFAPNRFVHVFTTHLQSSYQTVDTHAELVRERQMRQFERFAFTKTKDDSHAIVCTGDFNVDSYSVRNQGEHKMMLDVFAGFTDLLDAAWQQRGRHQQYHTAVTIFTAEGGEVSSTFSMCAECRKAARDAGSVLEKFCFLHPSVLLQYEPHLKLNLPPPKEFHAYDRDIVSPKGIVIRSKERGDSVSGNEAHYFGQAAADMAGDRKWVQTVDTNVMEHKEENRSSDTGSQLHAIFKDKCGGNEKQLTNVVIRGGFPAFLARGLARKQFVSSQRIISQDTDVVPPAPPPDPPMDTSPYSYNTPPLIIVESGAGEELAKHRSIKSPTIRNLHKMAEPGSLVVTPQRLDYILYHPKQGGLEPLSTTVQPFVLPQEERKFGCYRISDHSGIATVFAVHDMDEYHGSQLHSRTVSSPHPLQDRYRLIGRSDSVFDDSLV